MTATHDPALVAQKAAIDAERRAVLEKLRGRARAITEQIRAQTLRKNLLVRLRNNVKPKLRELVTLVGLSTAELEAIEVEALKSIEAAKAKSPDWKPHHPSRSWKLAELVQRFKKAGKI